jgi:DUF1680 family protein
VTGSARLLDVAIRLADHVDGIFGPLQAGKRPGTPGHPEIEMALVELARTTGEKRYLELARFFLDQRGRGLVGGSTYHQDHTPFRQMERLVGHAVRALYLAGGATDLYLENGDQSLAKATGRQWQNMVAEQLYASGGVGARYDGEALGEPYELPTHRAYSESCASVAAFFWSWRLLAATADAAYADLMELTLYNAFLAGISLDGAHYFQANPLASDGRQRRQPWIECACCPPNIARLLASLPAYFYTPADEGIWIHLYAEGMADIRLADGRRVTLIQHSHYPWDGEVNLEVDVKEGLEFSLFLRIPGWCREGAAVTVNGVRLGRDDVSAGGRRVTGPLQSLAPGTYVELHRVWQPGDLVQLRLPMAVRRIESHPYVMENRGRVALMRGPLLYCVEQADNPGIDPRDIVLVEGEPAVVYRPELLGGVVALELAVEVVPPAGWEDRLYRPAGDKETGRQADRERVTITAIPYYAWANREAGRMELFLATDL